MALSAKMVRSQLARVLPKVQKCSLDIQRTSQDALGDLMANIYIGRVKREEKTFGRFDGAWLYPSSQTRDGVVLYLHGGGYTCGSLEYATGFGSTLAYRLGMRVFVAAYRLAPEYKYPAAIDDALDAYTYLLDCGIRASSIILCGESAGGGLIMALCELLASLGKPLPAGVVAISPWTDLTLSGASYETNLEKDISLSREQLEYFADCYTHDATEAATPFVSPLFGDVTSMPPCLIFAGGDEILLDDSVSMHEKLRSSGRYSELVVGKGMWHAYVLYNLKENKGDFPRIAAFVDSVIPHVRGPRWMKLDNAAKIYPAAKRRNWNNMFRMSATLNEPIDRDILRLSLDTTVRRFPSIAAKLRRGLFWYYLEELDHSPTIEDERCSPLTHMPFENIRKCAIRVLVYGNRVAVEFYHAMTDGTGGMIFLKTLIAEYLSRKYRLEIPAEDGVLDRGEEPKPEELEDSFVRYAGDIEKSRSEPNAYHIDGMPERDGYFNLTTLMLSGDEMHAEAKKRGVTVTALICAALMHAICRIQDRHVPRRRQKPVKILVPVNLRKILYSTTLRNFTLYVTPGIDPRAGEWGFDEICRSVNHQLGLDVTEKEMTARITKNVRSEQIMLLRLMPLFIKNIAMKSVYDAVGEKKSCLDMSNLGVVTLPEIMRPYVKRIDFIIGALPMTHYNCGVLTYNGITYINFIRNTQSPELELAFFEELRSLGLKARVESNQRN